MADRPDNKASLGSCGARTQFAVAIVLISILPILTVWLLASRGELASDNGTIPHPWIMTALATLVCLGYALLRKYTQTIIRLRRYLEDTVRGQIPDAVELVADGDDIQVISHCMNIILARLKGQIQAVDRERRLLERQLYQAQKLESIGILAAGIAHEINTPVQFVGDNAKFIFGALTKMQALADRYRELLDHAEAFGRGQIAEIIGAAEKEADIEFLREEIPKAIAQTREGLERVTKIAAALRDFSYMGDDTRPEPADINAAITTTITISRNEWKYVADMRTDLDPGLPLVQCYPGAVKQTLIILITNAAQAIKEILAAKPTRGAEGASAKGTIEISTHAIGDHVEIRVRDTGAGIPAAVQPRIFDPFFTTKKIGEGTGQGLSIAYAAIVRKHGGTMAFQTEEGIGTTFFVRIPMKAGADDAPPISKP